MARAISFSLTFPTVEKAKKFVKAVGAKLQAPTLRYGREVYVCAADGDEMKAILAIGRDHHARDL